MAPLDEAARLSCPSAVCLLPEQAQSCIPSKHGPPFEFWTDFGQARSPRALAQQSCPASAWRHNARTSSRPNMLPTSHALAQPIKNVLAFDFWTGLPPAGRQWMPCQGAQRNTKRRTQVRLPSTIAPETCTEWSHRIPTRYRPRPMATRKTAPRSNYGACFAQMHGQGQLNATNATVPSNCFLARFCECSDSAACRAKGSHFAIRAVALERPRSRGV